MLLFPFILKLFTEGLQDTGGFSLPASSTVPGAAEL